MRTGQQTARRDEDRVPGSAPLKNPEHEKLAREYAAGASMAGAWRAIGRDPMKNGNQWRTFRRPDIQARVEYLRGEFNRMAGISLAALQARLLRIADANIADFFEADGAGRLRLRNVTTLPRAVTAPIAELRLDADGAIKLKVADKLHAIDSLLRTIGGFAPEKLEHSVSLEALVMQSIRMRTEQEPQSAEAAQRDAPPKLVTYRL